MKDLTPYQLKVLKWLVVEGLTCTGAAERYGVRVDSVRNAGESILRKTDSHRLAQAVYRLMKAGKID